jgi:transposase
VANSTLFVAYAESFLVLLVDNGGIHVASDLEIPENIFLLFQPPYSPELNPIERVWEYLKDQLGWKLFSDLKELEDKVFELLVNTTKEAIASLSGYPWILSSLNRAGI